METSKEAPSTPTPHPKDTKVSLTLGKNISSGECEIIKTHFLPLANNCIESLKLEDDIALIPLNSSQKLYNNSKTRIEITSTDTIQEGVHCKHGTAVSSIFHKLLARNLSDIASKGGVPSGYLLSIIAPNAKRLHSVDQFFADAALGLKKLSSEHNIPLIGGDISRGLQDNIIASITIFGYIDYSSCSKISKNNHKENLQEMPLRKNAKIGDFIYCTEEIGQAYYGFIGDENYLSKYERPNPDMQLAQKIAPYTNAMIDASDGFFSDLMSILRASKVSATIDYSLLPLANTQNKSYNLDNIAKSLVFGDDYNLIFTSSNSLLDENKKITKIGIIVENEDKAHQSKKDKTPNYESITVQNLPNELENDLKEIGYLHFKI